jgi:hypothetical protein
MKKHLQLSLVVAFTLLVGGVAQASPITYIFSGTGSGKVGGTGGTNGPPFAGDAGGSTFSGSFTLTLVGDTSTALFSGGEWFNSVSSAIFTGAVAGTLTSPAELIDNPAAGGFLGFAEFSPTPPGLAVEAMTGSTFVTYDLQTALPLTAGGVSFIPQIYTTSAGHVEFDSISSLSFQANTAPPAVPEPATLSLTALGLTGALARFRRRRPKS